MKISFEENTFTIQAENQQETIQLQQNALALADMRTTYFHNTTKDTKGKTKQKTTALADRRPSTISPTTGRTSNRRCHRRTNARWPWPNDCSD